MNDEQTPMAMGAPGEGDPAPVTKRRGRKPKVAAGVTVPAATPVVKVTSRRSAALDRRLAPGSNPNATAVRAIPLKEPSRWQLYIGNDYNSPDDLYRIVHEYGWMPLELADLACKPEEIGFRVNEMNHLVKGPQGREVIFKMDKADYALLMQRKTERNMVGIGSASKTRAQVAQAASNVFGDEAAEFIHRNIKGTVTDTQEPVI